VTTLNVEVGPKRLELMHELLPPGRPPLPCSSIPTIRIPSQY
jgi:hypothetical protein